MKKINVLELTTTLEVGGTENMLSYLVRGLDRERFNVTLACLTGGGRVGDELARDGFDVRPLGMKSKLDFGVVFRLCGLIREKKVDVLHTYLFHANLLGRIAGRLSGVPVIVSSERIMGLESWHRLLLNRITSPLASAFTANSLAVKEFMTEKIRLPPEKIHVIYNGVDTQKFGAKHDKEKLRSSLGLKPEDFVCVTVARLDEQKGVSYLVEAARKVVEKNPETKFLIVGDGPLKEKLIELSEKLGLTEHVLFLGQRMDVPKILGASDLFLLPSIWEGLPNVVLEAMAAGLAVVATKTSGTPELVVDGKTGFLVSPGDAVGLAGAILACTKDAGRISAMGSAGRKRAEEVFSLKKMINENEELYLKLAGGEEV